MKRCLAMLLVVICLCAGAMTVTASADSAATRVDVYCTVNIDGDCMVSLTANLHLETADAKLTFPLPANAKDITMNGSSVSATKTDSSMEVSLARATGGNPGDFPVRFEYSIPKAVSPVEVNGETRLQLTVPLLCGFSYPVNVLNYTVTVPKEIETRPDFYSTYRQNGIASDLNYTVNGSMVTGSSKTILNDHEAVTMSLIASREMFPSVSIYRRTGNPELVPMLAFAGAALLYWLIFLRTWPPRREDSSLPVEGITAGELGCRLTLSGGELTMMVMSWAQMGYLIISLDGNGRVLLHKRMEMGNERSLFEVRTFQSLFGNRRVVDCTGTAYAKLNQKTESVVPGEKTMCKPHSGNPRIFRGLLCISQVFCGICVAMNMTAIPALQVLLSILFGLLGPVTAWQIHKMAYCTYRRSKRNVYFGLACCALWVLLGWLAGQVWIPLGAVAGQWLAGYLAAFGGQRSDLNKHDVSQILGLRYYLKNITKEEVSRMMKADPDYFFRMAPYALAMGVIRPFAASFGKRKLDQCPYLITRIHGKRTAEDWAMLMQQTAEVMDERMHQMELEKLAAIRLR